MNRYSQRRIAASRANGARSRGPVTPEGKIRVSQNAIKHGLLAQTIVLSNENKDAFAGVLTELTNQFQPGNAVEYGLIEELAAAWWRVRRAWMVEHEWVEKHMAKDDTPEAPARIANAYDELAASHKLGQLQRYEARLDRKLDRVVRTLTLLRVNQEGESSQVIENQSVQTNLVPKSDTTPPTPVAQTLMPAAPRLFSAPKVVEGSKPEKRDTDSAKVSKPDKVEPKDQPSRALLRGNQEDESSQVDPKSETTPPAPVAQPLMSAAPRLFSAPKLVEGRKPEKRDVDSAKPGKPDKIEPKADENPN